MMADARAHTDDPDTSKLAALQLDPTAVGELKRAILVMLKPGPNTAFELRARYSKVAPLLGWPHVQPNSINRRLSELKKDGLVFDTGERRETPDGRMAAVMAVPDDLQVAPRDYPGAAPDAPAPRETAHVHHWDQCSGCGVLAEEWFATEMGAHHHG